MGKKCIHKHAYNIMDFEILPESSLIKKYVFRPPESTSKAPISIAIMQVNLNWKWAKHRPKQLSSGMQITLVTDKWKYDISPQLIPTH